MVYTAGSLSLAILEWRVNLAQWPPPATTIVAVEIPEVLIWIPPRLPTGWHRMPVTAASRNFGDAWIKSSRSAVLRVPSAVVPEEFNYLLNPAHPDFSRLVIGRPRVLKTDPRLGPMTEQ